MPGRFKNHYYLMRHGESEANVQGLIISDPTTGCSHFGLSQSGIRQVQQSIDAYHGPAISRVLCSDFLRTRQTAEIVTQTLGLGPAELNTGLRERFFGDWEGCDDHHYQTVWSHDAVSTQATLYSQADGVEAPLSVRQRGVDVLAELEQRYRDQCLLLVSHGDLLQILRSAFCSLEPGQHRQLPQHQTAEIQPLARVGDPLPSGWPTSG